MSLMNSFAKLNLRTKLVIGFSAVITFALIISATAIYGLNMLSENTQKMYDKDLIGISLLRSLNRDLNAIGRYTNRVILEVNAVLVTLSTANIISLSVAPTSLILATSSGRIMVPLDFS